MSNPVTRRFLMVLAIAAIFVAGAALLPAKAQQGPTTGDIAGVVTDVHGNPVHRAHVTLEDANHHALAVTSSDSHGEFHFHHVQPGHYTIVASKRGVGHGSAGVDVHAGHTANVQVVLH